MITILIMLVKVLPSPCFTHNIANIYAASGGSRRREDASKKLYLLSPFTLFLL